MRGAEGIVADSNGPQGRAGATWARRRVAPRGGEDGAMLVETAFVIPVFFAFLFGVFAFTFLLIAYLNGTYAANAGARYACLKSQSSLYPATTAEITNVVNANLFAIPTSGRTILVIYGNRSGGPGNYIGDDVGVAVILFNETISIPYWGSETFELQCQAYRFISR